jgi:predicted small lipoprotein YifL
MRLGGVALVIVLLAGCGRKPPNATPDGAVRELVERLRQVNGDVPDAKAAFELLSKRAQDNLAARAQRYSAASGKTITPEAMIAPARFALRFEPQRFVPRVSGTSALVEIEGPEHERADVPCLLEDGLWRVDLVLPPLPPVQQRPGTEPR